MSLEKNVNNNKGKITWYGPTLGRLEQESNLLKQHSGIEKVLLNPRLDRATYYGDKL